MKKTLAAFIAGFALFVTGCAGQGVESPVALAPSPDESPATMEKGEEIIAVQPEDEFVPPEITLGEGAPLLQCFHEDVAKFGPGGHFLGEWNLDRIPAEGVIEVAFIFTSFVDVQGDGSPLERAKPYIENMEALFESSSYGKVSFEFYVHDDYVSIPKESSVYGMKRWGEGDPGAVAVDAIRYGDPFVDFSDIDVLFVIPPVGSEFGWGPNMRHKPGEGWRSAEGTLDNVNVGEGTRPGAMWKEWWWSAHELTHSFGFAHPYDPAEVAIWDVTGWWTNTPELLGWHRLILDWVSESQVTCLEGLAVGEPVTGYLEKLNEPSSEPKMLVIRVSQSKVLVIEARHNGGLDKFPESDEGLLVYEVDLTKNTQSGEFVKIVLKSKLYEKGYVGTVIPGASVEYGNYFIRNLAQTDSGDYFEVTLLEDISPAADPDVSN